MEKPTRDRLTGAVIFFALLAIAVPELLSGPESPAPPAEATAEAGPPLTTYDLALAPTSDAQLARQRELTATPAGAAGAIDEAIPPPVAESAPEVAAPAAGEPARAPDGTSAATAGAWWVQLGVFSSSANAQKLAGEMRARGFDIEVATVTSGGRDLQRVRAGPAAGRAAAIALRDKLAGEGQTGTLIPP